jgi:hypothetical protein
MDSKADRDVNNKPAGETEDSRRDVVRKLGRFTAYAAPFTVLAFTKKADAATGGGPRPLGRR